MPLMERLFEYGATEIGGVLGRELTDDVPPVPTSQPH